MTRVHTYADLNRCGDSAWQLCITNSYHIVIFSRAWNHTLCLVQAGGSRSRLQHHHWHHQEPLPCYTNLQLDVKQDVANSGLGQ